MEMFDTLQGEGFHAGKAAFFIRLAGCDVGCSWCDVKESWEAENHPILELKTIKAAIANSKATIVVVTGGEPTLHPLEALVEAIHACGKQAHIETAGTNNTNAKFDWITFSPKKFKAPVDAYLTKAHELKVVAFNKHDILWATEWQKKLHDTCKLYIQCEWSKREQIAPMLVSFVKENPEWTLSVQTHKYLNIP